MRTIISVLLVPLLFGCSQRDEAKIIKECEDFSHYVATAVGLVIASVPHSEILEDYQSGALVDPTRPLDPDDASVVVKFAVWLRGEKGASDFIDKKLPSLCIANGGIRGLEIPES